MTRDNAASGDGGVGTARHTGPSVRRARVETDQTRPINRRRATATARGAAVHDLPHALLLAITTRNWARATGRALDLAQDDFAVERADDLVDRRRGPDPPERRIAQRAEFAVGAGARLFG